MKVLPTEQRHLMPMARLLCRETLADIRAVTEAHASTYLATRLDRSQRAYTVWEGNHRPSMILGVQQTGEPDLGHLWLASSALKGMPQVGLKMRLLYGLYGLYDLHPRLRCIVPVANKRHARWLGLCSFSEVGRRQAEKRGELIIFEGSRQVAG